MQTRTADEALAEVLPLLRGTHTFVVGSCVAAHFYGKPYCWNDVDVFTPSTGVFISTVQKMIERGWVLDTENDHDLVWHRYTHYGMKDWHTYSLKLHTLNDTQVNVVHKTIDGHPQTSLSQVLEAFDMGLLGIGYNMRTDEFRDMRPYWFDIKSFDSKQSVFPGIPERMELWLQGEFSQHVGLRQSRRYAQYMEEYNYDLSLFKPDLVKGYQNKALRLSRHKLPERRALGEIYGVMADLIEKDDNRQILDAYKVLEFNNPLDEILDSLA